MIYECIPYQICVLKAGGSRPGAPRSILHLFLIRYALKTYESRPGVPKRIYEYSP
jgi:hypothetical protein